VRSCESGAIDSEIRQHLQKYDTNDMIASCFKIDICCSMFIGNKFDRKYSISNNTSLQSVLLKYGTPYLPKKLTVVMLKFLVTSLTNLICIINYLSM
jgi:hypothetical protein